MITGNLPFMPSKKSQDGLLSYLRAATGIQWRAYNLREQFRLIDLAYQREGDYTEEQAKARLANRYGDPTKFQNITMPIVMPQVEAAVTYQASVFLTGTPLFPVVAAPSDMQAARALETIIDNQAIQGQWVAELTQTIRNAFKYNFYALEVAWKKTKVASFESDTDSFSKEGKPKQIIKEGNALRNLDVYNLIFDTRVQPSKMHIDGEYAGYTEIMSRLKFKSFLAELGDDKVGFNFKEAIESGVGETSIVMNSQTAPFYIPWINPDTVQIYSGLTEFNWMAWANLEDDTPKLQYRNSYRVTTLYARILPSDFGLKASEANTPQIWKFIYVNEQVLIWAERQTNAHNMLPIIFGQGAVDGLGFQTKSLASNEIPFQQLGSALWNSAMAAQRRNISDRMIYNPLYIAENQINNPNPAAKIPIRPAAYGKPLSEAVYPIPFRNDNLEDVVILADKVDQMANKLARSNPARQGQFVKGNKTRSEFDSVMANATGEDQLRAIQFESYLFTPLKEILKINILQYQTADTMFNTQDKKPIEIDPVQLRKTVMSFKLSDGLIPADRLAKTEVIRDGFQTLANVPAIASGYNLTPMFSYLMKIQGADIEEFEKPAEQVAFEQAMAQWQQMIMQLMKANPNIQQNQYPPQPLPEQFGYNPQQQFNTEEKQEDGTATGSQANAGMLSAITNNTGGGTPM